MIYTNDFKALTDIVNNLNRAENEKYFVDKCEKMFSSLESIIGLYIDYSIKEKKVTKLLNNKEFKHEIFGKFECYLFKGDVLIKKFEKILKKNKNYLIK